MKKVLSILLAAVLMLSLSVTAFAAGSSITYEGDANKYVFVPDTEYTDSDLFNNFKDVMPGDTITQEIQINCNIKGNYYVKIYLKAVPHVEGAATEDEGKIHDSVVEDDKYMPDADKKVATMEDFLHQLSMTINIDDKEIYNASPDELNGLADWVLLGHFFDGDKKTMKVNLEVPIELGNEYAFRAGEVDWVFKAEEIPYTPDPSPKTGDNSNIVLYAGLMVGALTVLCAIFVFLRKRKSAE